MKLTKNIFFTSDLHLGHENAIKLDQRPFKNTQDMYEGLVRRFNACLSDDSVLYVLGDVGLGKGALISEFLKEIKGTKVLILGNHDKPMFASYGHGWDVVLNNASFYIGNQLVTMSHCPLLGLYREDMSHIKGHEDENWHGEKKNFKFTTQDVGQFHLHGHIHSRPNRNVSKRIEGRQLDVGLPANNYQPVSYQQVHSWIMSEVDKNQLN